MALSVGSLLRSWHKWLGLVAGIQLLIWSVSGFYMVAVDLDFIHGDSLVRDPVVSPAPTAPLIGIQELAARYPQLQGARLRVLPGSDRWTYELRTSGGRSLIDATSGEVLSPLPRTYIESAARVRYRGNAEVVRAELLPTLPVEARGRTAPLWRVDFKDSHQTSFYLDPVNADLVARRHRWWRLYDTFWMLHLMDYGDARDDVNNVLLRSVSSLGLVFGITGIWLLFFSFGRRKSPPRHP